MTIDALVFRSLPGQRLTGKVNKSCGSHIGLLVYNLFNAMVPAEELRKKGYEFDRGVDEWVKDGETNVGVGDELDFTTELFQECAGLISIEGTLP